MKVFKITQAVGVLFFASGAFAPPAAPPMGGSSFGVVGVPAPVFVPAPVQSLDEAVAAKLTPLIQAINQLTADVASLSARLMALEAQAHAPVLAPASPPLSDHVLITK